MAYCSQQPRRPHTEASIMREITVALEDENLYAKVEAEASSSGRTVQDIFIEAVKQWVEDADLDEDPDANHEVRPEVERELRESLKTPKSSLLTSDQAWKNLED